MTSLPSNKSLQNSRMLHQYFLQLINFFNSQENQILRKLFYTQFSNNLFQISLIEKSDQLNEHSKYLLDMKIKL